MHTISFLVYDVFDADLDVITIYRCAKTLDNLDKPSIQALLNLLRGCMTNRLVNDTVTFTPSSVLMESTPNAARMWGLHKVNIIFPTLYSPHQEPGTAPAPHVASSDINLNLYQHFL